MERRTAKSLDDRELMLEAFLQKKSSVQKEYLLKLKNEIDDFVVNFKKRYDRFPWKKLLSIKKIRKFDDIIITVNKTKFGTKELIRDVSNLQTKLGQMCQSKYFNYIIRAYLKDARGQEDAKVKDIYTTYHKELKLAFKEMQDDLYTAYDMLSALTKSLNQEKEVKEGTEMNTVSLEDIEKELFEGTDTELTKGVQEIQKATDPSNQEKEMDKAIQNNSQADPELKKALADSKLESALSDEEYQNAKKALYEACANGEMTIEEREETLQTLKEEAMVKAISPDTEKTGMSNFEAFEAVRKDLYEKYGKGEITLETREALITEAREIFFTESTEEEKEESVEEPVDGETEEKPETESTEKDKEENKSSKRENLLSFALKNNPYFQKDFYDQCQKDKEEKKDKENK